eukprot:TRINITY_DN1954_c0_g3_i1.p1 TRINITY_DN1954_c0_g3~~TRINITY_DN1954_c0_g3_i1.p1  ORF type:complete len:1117 (+),score=237.93 TRINITY_DN1954_c0_g3_i1:356-3706(+)
MSRCFVPSARFYKKYQDQAANALNNKQKDNNKNDDDDDVVVIPEPIVVSPAVVKAAVSNPAIAQEIVSFLDVFSRGKTAFELNLDTSSYSLCSANIHTLDQHFLSSELYSLLDLFEGGFISAEEYEVRKKQLETVLNRDAQSKTGLSRDSGSFLVVDGVHYNGLSKTSSTGLNTALNNAKQRMLRVFLSSTFRDMQDERDQLVKVTFPQLRSICVERGVFFSEVDLRWGITAEQAESGEVLDLCLSEIDRCRPYFINITGNRYGWIPSMISPSIVQKYPWLANNQIIGEKSITELEVLHGALNNVSQAKRSRFYIKKYQSVLSTSEADHPQKLESLKTKIKGSGLTWAEYATPQDLAEQVKNDLINVINQDFPQGSKPSKLESEEMIMKTFAAKKTRVYVGRNSYRNTLDAFVNNDSSVPIVVIGEEGSGKSSLLSSWFLQQQQKTSHLLIAHFLGASSESADPTNFIRRIMETMKKEYAVEEDISTEADKLVRDFSRWLKTYPTNRKRLILVIDGLDEIVDDGTLSWLPSSSALASSKGNVKLILSTRKNHKTHEILRDVRSLRESIELEPLNATEKQTIGKEYLALFAKSTTDTQMKMLIESLHASNPHFLRLVLEELRVFGVYERVEEKLAYYLRSRSISELYERIIERLETDFDKSLVRDVLSLLLASRRGLSEVEILGTVNLIRDKVTRLEISPLLMAFEDQNLIVLYNGLINLNHESLRKAIERRYLPYPVHKKRYHLVIADYFESKLFEFSPYGEANTVRLSCDISRVSEELPYHLLTAEHWWRLLQVVTCLPVFLQLSAKDKKFELKKYWIALEQKHYDVVESYTISIQGYEEENQNVLKSPSSAASFEFCKILLKVAKFLRILFQYEGARSLLTRVISLLGEPRRGDAGKCYAKCLYVMAQTYWNQGRWNDAEVWALKVLALREEIYGTNSVEVAKCLTGLGEVYIGEGEFNKAEATLTRGLQIFQNYLGREHHLSSRILHDLAAVENSRGQYDKSISLHQEAIRIREKTLGAEHPQLAVSFETYAATLKLAGREREAETAIKRALKINEDVHGLESINVAGCCDWLVLILRDMGRHGEADDYEKRSRKIQNELEQKGITATERTID